MIKELMYIELKTGYSDNGPAWIGFVMTSKTKKTIAMRNEKCFRFVNTSNRSVLIHFRLLLRNWFNNVYYRMVT